MRSPQPLAYLVVALVVLAVLLQLVPLYTDWLWFQEVGYPQVFLTTLSLRGSLFGAIALVVALFLWANLTVAAIQSYGTTPRERWDSLIHLMQSGNVYVNVHTAKYGGGEIRGQLAPR